MPMLKKKKAFSFLYNSQQGKVIKRNFIDSDQKESDFKRFLKLATNDKEHFLKLIEMGEDRYKLMEDNPEYFAPKENLEGKDHPSVHGPPDNPVDHPNRYAYKKLFNHLKSEGIV